HELDDQMASFTPIVKWAARVDRTADLPEALAEAWRQSMTPPTGPVYVEVPLDLLQDEVDVPGVGDLVVEAPAPSAATSDSIREAASLLGAATRPVIWAGGGVLRSGGWDILAAFAERLDAPVATTYMGTGGFPEDHPLSAGSTPDDHAFQELLQHADVVLCVATELGAETTAQYALHFEGRVI